LATSPRRLYSHFAFGPVTSGRAGPWTRRSTSLRSPPTHAARHQLPLPFRMQSPLGDDSASEQVLVVTPGQGGHAVDENEPSQPPPPDNSGKGRSDRPGNRPAARAASGSAARTLIARPDPTLDAEPRPSMDTVAAALTQQAPASSTPPEDPSRANAAPEPTDARGGPRTAAFQWTFQDVPLGPRRQREGPRSPSPGQESGYTGRTEADLAGGNPGPARPAGRGSARQAPGRPAPAEREPRRARAPSAHPPDYREISPDPLPHAGRQAQAAAGAGPRRAAPEWARAVSLEPVRAAASRNARGTQRVPVNERLGFQSAASRAASLGPPDGRALRAHGRDAPSNGGPGAAGLESRAPGGGPLPWAAYGRASPAAAAAPARADPA